MLLTIDCGNTNTVFAVFDGDQELGMWRTSTDAHRTADEYAVWLTQLMGLKNIGTGDITAAIIANVVPTARFELVTLVENYFHTQPLVIGDPGVQLGLENLIARPEQAGADRLVNAVAAHQLHKGALIVIDFGTATTFDIVSGEGNYCGGVIAPGVNLSIEALCMASAQLPRVAIVRPEKVIGDATVSAMQSGIFWGYVSMVEGMVKRITAEYGEPMTVIATGGLAPMLADVTDVIDEVSGDLTVRGLVEIYRRNVGG
ncbi:MAG: type III pantothenate kinase [Alphaproteobacteria bacterium]